MSANAGDDEMSVPLAESSHVMAAFDRSDGVPTFVIADVSVDDAWLSTPAADARSLSAWR